MHFIITLTDKGKEAIEKDGLEKAFKTTSKLNTSNMVVFDAASKIKKFATPEEILLDFYDTRLDYYHKRKVRPFHIFVVRHVLTKPTFPKAFVVAELTFAHEKLSNQARFIQMIITKELVISNRKRNVIVAELRAKNFKPIPKIRKAQVAADPEADDNEDEATGADSDFDYLLGMALFSLTAEKVSCRLQI